MEERCVPVHDRTLWSAAYGEDQAGTVLLIAGANASGYMWPDAFVDGLVERGLRVIRYDHRDTGRSTCQAFEASPYTLEDLARDAIGILDAWAVARAHVVGLSVGATLGQVMALDHPDRLHSLVLMCGAALDVDFVGNIVRALSGEQAQDGLPLPDKAVLEALADRATPSASLEEELDRRVKEWRLLAGEGGAFDAADFRSREARCIAHAGTWVQPGNHAMATPVPLARGEALRLARVPTLVIQGMLDPLNPPPHGRYLADRMGNARLLEVAEMGHCLPAALLPRLVEEVAAHVARSQDQDGGA